MAEPETSGDHDGGGPGRGAIVALILVVLLVLGGIVISQRIRAGAQIQDCVMAGRTNCAPVH